MSRKKHITIVLSSIIAIIVVSHSMAATTYLVSPGGGSSTEGGLTILVDQYGAFGHYELSSGAVFNPYGSLAPADTTYQSGIHVESSSTYSSFLSSGPLANLTGGSFSSTTATKAVSSFSEGGLDFVLTQEVRDRLESGVKKGSQLVQTYSIRNVTASTLIFSLTRYIDGDLYFEGGFSNDWGGVSSYTATMDQTLFEFDSGDDPTKPMTYLGIRALGGSVPSDAFEVLQYSDLRSKISSGQNLSNTVQGDSNGDRITDYSYDVSLGLKREFSLEPGNSTTYVAVTDFGLGEVGQSAIENIPVQKQSGHRTSGHFGWDYSYDLSFTDQQLLVDIDIQLVGYDPGDALRNQWEQGIEGIWSNQYEVVDGTYTYPILFNVDWVGSRADADHVVTVHAGTGRTNMLNWYTDMPGGWSNSYQDEVAAHEAGHMMGLYDEYSGGAVDPATGFTTTNALMADLGPVQERYYQGILAWLEGRSGRDLSLANAPYPPYPLDSPIPGFNDPMVVIPAPGAIYLALTGIIGLIGARRKFKALT